MTKKRIFSLALLLIIIAIAVFVTILKYDEYKVQYSGQIKAVVDKEISINRNSNGIPLINCFSENDLYFTLGFLHAQDKLPVILYYRLLADANLKSIIKNEEDLRNLTFLIESIEIENQAEIIYNTLDDEYKKYLENYSSGINYFIKKKYIGNSKISYWSPQDSIKILLLRHFSDSYISDRNLQFLLEKDDYYKILRLSNKGSMRYFNNIDKNHVTLLLNYKKLLDKYVGGFNIGLIGYRYTNDKKIQYFLNLEAKGSMVPDVYPIYFNNSGKYLQGVTYTGLPFIFYGINDAYSYGVVNHNLDLLNFKKIKLIKKEDKYYYYEAGKNNELACKDSESYENDKQYVHYYADERPVISIIEKNNESNEVVILKYNFKSVGYISNLFDLPFKIDTIDKNNSIDTMPHKIIYRMNDTSIVNVNFYGKGERTSQYDYILDNSYYNKNYISYYNKKRIRLNKFNNHYFSGTVGDSEKEYINLSNNYNVIRYKNIIKLLKSKMNIADIIASTRTSYFDTFHSTILKQLKKIPVTSARLTNIYFDNWDYYSNSEDVAPGIIQHLFYNIFNNTFYDEINNYDIFERNIFSIADSFNNFLKKQYSGYFDDKNTPEKYEDIESIIDKAFLSTMREMHRTYGPKMDEWKYNKIIKTRLFIPKIIDKIYPDVEITSFGDFSSVNKTELLYDKKNKKLILGSYTVFILYTESPDKANYKIRIPVSLDYFSDYHEVPDYNYESILKTSDTKYTLVIQPY